MPSSLRRYLLVEHVAGAVVFNFLLNALISWLAFRPLDVVPLWGQQSIVGDTVGTSFVLPVLTCLIVTRIVRWHLRQGRIQSPVLPPGSFALVRGLPEGIGRRSLVLAAVVTLMVAPVAVALLGASGMEGMELGPFVVFKAAYAALIGAWVQPVVALRALLEPAGASALATIPAGT